MLDSRHDTAELHGALMTYGKFMYRGDATFGAQTGMSNRFYTCRRCSRRLHTGDAVPLAERDHDATQPVIEG
jgi:hypothetical protein